MAGRRPAPGGSVSLQGAGQARSLGRPQLCRESHRRPSCPHCPSRARPWLSQYRLTRPAGRFGVGVWGDGSSFPMEAEAWGADSRLLELARVVCQPPGLPGCPATVGDGRVDSGRESAREPAAAHRVNLVTSSKTLSYIRSHSRVLEIRVSTWEFGGTWCSHNRVLYTP